MSKNLSQLAKRQGIDHTLFQELVIGEDSQSKAQRKDIAKDFLIGEAIVHGTASFYDFIDGENANKKAYVCNGSSCLCAETQADITDKLADDFGKSEVGHVTCLVRCAENSAFQIGGENFSGDDIEKYEVDYQRTPANSVVLTGAQRWSQLDTETYDIVEEIEGYADLASGSINTLIMDKLAFAKLRKIDNQTRKKIVDI